MKIDAYRNIMGTPVNSNTTFQALKDLYESQSSQQAQLRNGSAKEKGGSGAAYSVSLSETGKRLSETQFLQGQENDKTRFENEQERAEVDFKQKQAREEAAFQQEQQLSRIAFEREKAMKSKADSTH